MIAARSFARGLHILHLAVRLEHLPLLDVWHALSERVVVGDAAAAEGGHHVAEGHAAVARLRGSGGARWARAAGAGAGVAARDRTSSALPTGMETMPPSSPSILASFR